MPKEYRDSDPLLGGVLYAGGSYTKGGSYMPDYTVLMHGILLYGKVRSQCSMLLNTSHKYHEVYICILVLYKSMGP
jgi:hypothetical protein